MPWVLEALVPWDQGRKHGTEMEGRKDSKWVALLLKTHFMSQFGHVAVAAWKYTKAKSALHVFQVCLDYFKFRVAELPCALGEHHIAMKRAAKTSFISTQWVTLQSFKLNMKGHHWEREAFITILLFRIWHAVLMAGEVLNSTKNTLFSLALNRSQEKASVLGFVEALKLFLQPINGGCQPDLRTDDPEM